MSINFPGPIDGPDRLPGINNAESLKPGASRSANVSPGLNREPVAQDQVFPVTESLAGEAFQVTDRFGNKAYYSQNGGLVLVTLENASKRGEDVGRSGSPFVIVLAAIPAFHGPKAATPPDTKSKKLRTPLQAELPSELQEDKRGEGEDVTGMYQEAERRKAFSFKTENLLKTLRLIDIENHDGKISVEELEDYIQKTGQELIDLKPQILEDPQDEVLQEKRKGLIAQRRRARMMRRYFDVIAAIDGDAGSLSLEDIRKLAAEDGNSDRVSYEDIELYLHHVHEHQNNIPKGSDTEEDKPQGTNKLAQEVRDLIIEINLLGHFAGHQEEVASPDTEDILTREELEHGQHYFQNLLSSMANYAAYPQFLPGLKSIERKMMLTHMLLQNFDRFGTSHGETFGIDPDDISQVEGLEI